MSAADGVGGADADALAAGDTLIGAVGDPTEVAGLAPPQPPSNSVAAAQPTVLPLGSRLMNRKRAGFTLRYEVEMEFIRAF